MTRARINQVAGTVAGMIVAIILFALIAVLQTIDDSDAQKLRQQIEARK